MDCIVASNRNTAELFGIVDEVGTVEKGKFRIFLASDLERR